MELQRINATSFGNQKDLMYMYYVWMTDEAPSLRCHAHAGQSQPNRIRNQTFISILTRDIN